MSERILGLKELRELLPIGYPMLMLDRVCIESENRGWAVKNLSINELFFQGHFPNHAIMPGVLQVEAMRQLGELLVAERLDPERGGQIYMRVVEKVKFRNPNNPGDRMKIEAEVLSVENREAVIQARTSNKSGVTCQAQITLAVREKSSPAAMPELYNEYDKCAETPMNTEQIQNMVPHRYPFLLIDHIASVSAGEVVAIKNLSANEELFQAYPADCAMMPEALLCEISAQAGCACVLSHPDNKGKIGYFMTIDRAESLAPIFPGDQLICKVSLPPSKGRFGKGSGVIYVNGREVFNIMLMFAIVDA